MSVDQETLVLRRGGVSPPLSLLIPTFAFPDAPEQVILLLQGGLECSPTDPKGSHVFGGRLDTRLLSTPELSTSELLRTL